MSSRREEIINVTLDLIIDKGFDNLSYQDISNIVGIRKASIHYHFPHKVDLGIAVCDYMDALYDELIVKVDNVNSIERKLDIYFEFYNPGNKKNTSPYFSLLSSYNTSSDLMQEKLSIICDKEYALLEDILKKGIKNNEFELSGPLDLQVITMLSAVKGAYKYFRIMNYDYVANVRRYFLDQLMTKPMN